MRIHRRRHRQFLPIALALAGLATADSARALDNQKRILVLYSVRRDAQIAILGDQQLPRAIEAGLGSGVDYYSEYLDNARFLQPEYRAVVRDFLQRKYADQKFDLVIAMSTLAVNFVSEHRRELFSDTPVVFFRTTPLPNIPNSTGVVAELSLRGTIALAGQLQPDLRRVFVVTGAEDNDHAYEQLARRQLHSLGSEPAISYLSGLTTTELETRLATLPDHSMVLYLVVSSDGAGEHFHPLAYLDRVAAVANAPTYSWVDSTLGHGIVGGSLRSQDDQIAAVAGFAVRVLRGEPAAAIPPLNSDLNVAQVDWRQLRRWGIRESRVPAGTLIRFREPNIWDRYRSYILGAVALMSAQSCLIALLLVQRARRRQAEAEVRGGQAQLRASYERIRDLGGRLLLAQEAERTRIARELHDDVGQQLALLAIDLELVAGTGPDLEREAGTLIDESLTRARRIAKAVHDLSHRLHPEKLHLLGLVSALAGIQREFSLPNLTVTFAHDNVPAALPHDVTLCLFRVAQEALQNIIKHSGASAVSIQLIGTETGLILTIVDDGMGFNGETEQHTGLGLVSMRERLDAIGGLLRISTKPGAGTRLEISVPHERVMSVPA